MACRNTAGDGRRDVFHVEHKVWLEKEGAVFGDGLFKLLSNVARLGSISWAAREMGMSYRAAWGKIKSAEEHWGVALVVTQVGGEMGGGAKLTPEAEELLKRFQKLRQEVDLFVRNSFNEIFQGR
jgi:molybdate transport system regulatory protein